MTIKRLLRLFNENNLWEWYKSIKSIINATVYHDHHRKGWFFRIGDERHGYSGSLDRGYESRQKALEGLARYYIKHYRPETPQAPEDEAPKVTTIPYYPKASTIRTYRHECYGPHTPGSGSNWVEKFIEHLNDKDELQLTDFSKSDIDHADNQGFSLAGLLDQLGYRPLYDENNNCIGATDL